MREDLTQHWKLAYHCLFYFFEQNPIIVFDQIKTKRILRQESKFCLKHKLTINKAISWVSHPPIIYHYKCCARKSPYTDTKTFNVS